YWRTSCARVSDGAEWLAGVAIDVVDQGAKRRGFAGAGRPRDQDEPLRQMAELQDLLGEAHLLRRDDLAGNDAKHPAHPLAVHEEIAAEARESRYLVGE